MRAAMIMLALLAAPAGAATIQQDFDAAQTLLDAGKAAEARDAFTALLGRFAPTSQGMSASLVRARLGNALLGTGDPEAAEPLLVTAIAGLKGSDAISIDERGVALYDLGRAQERQGKLDSAAKAFAQVRDAKLFPADDPSDLGLRAALARALIWSNPAESRRLLDELLALPPEKLGKSKDNRAQLETLRGRVELNSSNPAEALKWFTAAARSAGGAETTTVSLTDVRVRGDLALANFKLGKMDEVQKYIAFSGAGGLAAEGLTLALDTPVPACAPVTGLAPDAVAVVEFSIGSDGRVTSATPIYASHGSGPATDVPDTGPEVVFAQAVRRWVWNTENAAKLNPFWRQAVRVELRCLTTRPDGDPISRSFDADYRRWLATTGARPIPKLPDNDAAALPVLLAELAQRERTHGAQSLQLLPVLGEIANNTAASPTAQADARRRRLELLTAAQAPDAVIGRARINNIRWAAGAGNTSRESARIGRDQLLPLLANQEAGGAGETRMAMWTRLELAEALDTLAAVADSRALLDRIVAAPGNVLPDGDPIRTAALLRMSNQAAAARDMTAAAKALAATGLAPEQCALVDVRPQAINATLADRDFPDAARRWSTGGYAKTSYDITAAGTTTNIRTIVAAPPFIFGPPTEKAVARFRYQPVFRPGNTIGCTGRVQPVRYRMAG
jgi:tetratricopeptide (TPR) repeat protein